MQRPMDTLVLNDQRKEEVMAVQIFMIQDPDLGRVAFKTDAVAVGCKADGDAQVVVPVMFFDDVADFNSHKLVVAQRKALEKLTEADRKALGLENFIPGTTNTPNVAQPGG